jgi:hypothetical protein
MTSNGNELFKGYADRVYKGEIGSWHQVQSRRDWDSKLGLPIGIIWRLPTIDAF